MKEYIKSPLNYVGGKYKLLNQIIPLIPDNINTFIDLFGGGFNVGINITANKVIYNDMIKQVVDLLNDLNKKSKEEILNQIDRLIAEYELSKENQEGYLNLRSYYNNHNKDSIVFYTLICYEFNNQIRFNSSGEYNMPFGKNRSSFNPALRDKFCKFVEQLHKGSYLFTNNDFRKIKVDKLSNNDYIYCDPPYFNSTATYNENGGWTEQDEKDLLDMLEILNNKGIKFGLSNNLKYDNPLLNEWKSKYNVHYLNINYGNCNYQKKDKTRDIEVFITNY
jgi:DNA adenine methylase Dam